MDTRDRAEGDSWPRHDAADGRIPGVSRPLPGRRAPVDDGADGHLALDGLDLGEVALRCGRAAIDGVDVTNSRSWAELLSAIGRMRSALEALNARAMTEFERASLEEADGDAAGGHGTDGDVPSRTRDRDRARAVPHHIAFAMGQDVSRSRHRLATSRRLVTSMPHILSALATGRISPEAAHAAARGAAPLDPERCREVDRVCGEHMGDLDAASSGQWQREIAHLAHRIAPTEHAVRHERARATAGVRFTRGEYGIDHLHADLPALDAAAIRRKLTLTAEHARLAGDDTPAAQIMVTALADTLLGRDEGLEPVRLDVGVMITDRALRSPDCGDPAIIEGYGPVHPAAVREALADRDLRGRSARGSGGGRPATGHPLGDAGECTGENEQIDPRLATLRRVHTHPTTGELVAMEARSRAFPTVMMRQLMRRDERCAAPYCNAPIRHTDHVIPHARGGPTSIENGQGLCAACNLVKEQVARVRVASARAQPPERESADARSPGCENDTGPRERHDGSGASTGRVTTWHSRMGRVVRVIPPTLSGRAWMALAAEGGKRSPRDEPP